jgi:hypothetical protein
VQLEEPETQATSREIDLVKIVKGKKISTMKACSLGNSELEKGCKNNDTTVTGILYVL